MSQFLIAGIVFVAALAATLHHRQTARTAAAELSQIEAEKAAAKATLAALQARTTAASKRQAELSLDLTAASAELKAASEVALRARTEPDPTTEGAWPADKPYFYLPKRLLPEIGFAALTAEGAPTPEAIALLGLTPSERDDLANAWAEFRFSLQELQLQSAERLPDTNAVPDPNRPSIRFKLSGLTNHIPQLQAQIEAKLTEAVGSIRAQILRSPLEDMLDNMITPIGSRDCFVTYYAERDLTGAVQHHVQIEADDETRLSITTQVGFFRFLPSSPDVQSPYRADESSLLWHYRHLFGDQPLLPLP